jgi:hypothetical protein
LGKRVPRAVGGTRFEAPINADRGAVQVKFGDVIVTTSTPAEVDARRYVAFSSEALARANTKIAKAGVRLYPKKDVPLFFADADEPGVFVRELNGTVARGRVEDGQFKVLEGERRQAID